MTSDYQNTLSDSTNQIAIQPKGLVIVATPIGNMQDITLRALGMLKAVDIIACEDTRMSKKLMTAYGIKTPLISYHEHSDERSRQKIISLLTEGKSVALISDAGTPLISDPGYKLLQEVTEAGIEVTSLPGPSSVTTALTLAGLPTNRFLFEGFLPPKSAARQTALSKIQKIEGTLVFFESAKRLQASLADMLEVLGDRQAAVLRELTKTYEEVKRGTLSELISYYQEHGDPKGEVVITLAPPLENKEETDFDDLLKSALNYMSVKDSSAFVAEVTGVAKKKVYQRAIKMSVSG